MGTSKRHFRMSSRNKTDILDKKNHETPAYHYFMEALVPEFEGIVSLLAAGKPLKGL
jgi:hypothetical protein